MRILFFTLLATAVFSCTSLLKKMYKTDRPFDFKSRQEYVQYLEKAGVIDPANMIYLDKNAFESFASIDLLLDSSQVYLGSFVNDSQVIKKSYSLKEKQSCSGRVSSDIKKIAALESIPDSILENTIKLSSFQMRSLKDGNPVVWPFKKTRIILLYSYTLGIYYNDLYKEISRLVNSHKDKMELIVLSLDPVDYLPPESVSTPPKEKM